MPVFAVRVSHALRGSIVAGLALLSVAPACYADPVVHFDILVTGGSNGPYADSFDQVGTPTANPQVFNFQGPVGGYNDPFGQWSIETWDFNADADPSGSGAQTGARLGAVFTVQNLLPDGPTAADNHLYFSIMITMDISPVITPSSFFGNGGMTLTIDDSDSNFPGQVTAINSPIWNYIINGNDVASLFDPGFFLGGSDGPGTASTSANLLPAQTGPLVGLTPTSIGIRLDFDLSPGEKVTFNGVFGFVPTPGVMALLLGVGLFGRPRRRA